MAAIKAGNLEELKELISRDASLATSRSASSHPTLLQFLALEALNVPNKVEMANVLLEAGAEIEEPLAAAACIDNVDIVKLLLDRGGSINGTGSWSLLEEALYWGNQRVIDLLLERGASLHNLRIAAGLGRTDLIESFFNSDGTLKPEAGAIDWPFRGLTNAKSAIGQELRAKAESWSNDPPHVIDNAFVYACMQNHLSAARLLLEKGARINAIPPGFDYSGTALHYAAIKGHRAMIDLLLEHGADVNIKDTKVKATAAGWAEHGGQTEIKDYLNQHGGQS